MGENGARLCRCVLVVLVVLVVLGGEVPGEDIDAPAVNDPRLQIALFASDPEIVTPIDLEVDDEGRVFVIESHTHVQARDYPGPDSDRVKVFTDADGDGRSDPPRIFAEGFDDAMTLALAPGGVVYVCHRSGVVALSDTDGDGVADRRRPILELDTPQTYAHSCLLGVVLSSDGWLYVSRGNLGGYPYTIRGLPGGGDGEQPVVKGYGDGGNIVRLRPDGTGLEEVATGFWNPFGLEIDGEGRLLATDNDPDSRGPNRLLQIIPGGDYGFKSLYGPSGRHPYVAWNGELPGTLPSIAGTGEAPCAVFDAERAALPRDYEGSVLVAVWGENSVERFRLRPAGVSLKAEREVLIQGGKEFRPVGIAAGPDGSIYISDWVKRDYPNHGKGRIWRLTVRAGVETKDPRSPFALYARSPASDRVERIPRTRLAMNRGELLELAESEDPFVRSAAISALSAPAYRSDMLQDLTHARPARRLNALLALRRSRFVPPDVVLKRLLGDADEAVRKMTLIWTGELRVEQLRDDLELAIAREPVSADLLRTYLATVQILSPEGLAPVRRKVPGFRIRRTIRPAVVETLVADTARPDSLRAGAMALLGPECSKRTARLLIDIASGGHGVLQREAVRSLATTEIPGGVDALERVAEDRRQPPGVRADALVGLGYLSVEDLVRFVALLEEPDIGLEIEAARLLRKAAGEDVVRRALVSRRRSLRGDVSAGRLDEQLRFALASGGQPGEDEGSVVDRPETVEEWRERAVVSGDVERGWRIFHHPVTRCSDCHRVGGRGGEIGPDLSSIARSIDRKRLIESIVDPSAEVSPEFQSYTVVMNDGSTLSGLQFHYRGTDRFSIFVQGQGEIRRDLKDALVYAADEQSLMPEGLEGELTVGDMCDLLAYLMAGADGE